MRILPCALLLLLLSLFPGHGAGADRTITVFAAASLSDALKEIVAAHEKSSGDIVRLNLSASSTLARQIEEGAPADLFFSADEAQMDRLAARGLIRTNSRVTRLSNTLVIVLSAENAMPFPSAASLTNPAIRRIALAEPKTVPAGVYAREFLVAKKLWSAVEPKVIPTANVRAALAAVESGNVEAAIVYQTDARISKKVRVAHEVPAAEGPRIRYPVALTRDAPNVVAAERFLRFLNSPKADRVFERFGFIVAPRSP
jgi:molybdate transport system substrate-binding protein